MFFPMCDGNPCKSQTRLKSKSKDLQKAIERTEDSVQAALLAADVAERKEVDGTLPPEKEKNAEQWLREAHRQSGLGLRRNAALE